jgi:hypothetical protein
MTRDEVVAFPLSDPAVPAASNPGRRAQLPARNPRSSQPDDAARDQRDALSAKFCSDISPDVFSNAIRDILVDRETAAVVLRPASARACWPPLKPELSALQS